MVIGWSGPGSFMGISLFWSARCDRATRSSGFAMIGT
jgi:hypothetical protein